MVACANSSWIIVVISIERWFAVCKPFQKSRLFTKKRVASAILCLFIASLIFFSYFPFIVSVIKSNSTTGTTTNETFNNYSTEYEYKCDMIEKYTKHYKYLGFVSIILIYFVPFFILAILNAIILCRLRVSPFKTKLNLIVKNKILKNNETQIKELETKRRNSLVLIALQKMTSNGSKNDRSLHVTLLSVSITFMILTFPFQFRY